MFLKVFLNVSQALPRVRLRGFRAGFLKKSFDRSHRIFNARCCANDFRLPQDVVIQFDKHKILRYHVNGLRKILWCRVLVKDDRARRDMIG